jgi:uncharacterized RDD family membrane protein YckC
MSQPPDPNPPQPDQNIPQPAANMPPPAANVPPPDPNMQQPNMGTPPPQAGNYPAAPPVPMAAYGQPNVQAIPGMYFDQASGLQLPEGVELASVGRRIGAFFLSIPLVIVTLGIGYIIWGLIVWANGQTPALQVLGMRCWRTDDNRVANWGWMALREIVGRILEDILGFITELISLILMCTRPDRRAIHDLIAGTVVLYDPNKVTAPRK